jgi:hypothetical protein
VVRGFNVPGDSGAHRIQIDIGHRRCQRSLIGQQLTLEAVGQRCALAFGGAGGMPPKRVASPFPKSSCDSVLGVGATGDVFIQADSPKRSMDARSSTPRRFAPTDSAPMGFA